MENFSAAALPKNTPVTQPRFSPLIATAVPPPAGPEAGLIESTFGLPGGYRKNSSAGGFAAQPVTLQTSTSSSPAADAGAVVVMRESLATA